MPVTNLRCAACGAEFIDSRSELVEHDEAICPRCGARNEFTREFADAHRLAGVEPGDASTPAHSEPEVKKPS
ncbi:MAG TPA: hypothetical protein VKB52_17075 [Rhodanobacteraceae bacterium]|nr:hypothetical protein [Rhodanobacteraceae bacterium]